jgi:hypothetical protein
VAGPSHASELRRVLYELGASSIRYGGAAARVQRVSTARLINSSGGQGGASARRHRLTPFAVEVLAALTQAQEAPQHDHRRDHRRRRLRRRSSSLSILVDGYLKLARIRADAKLPRRAELRYCRAELEVAVKAAVSRTGYVAGGGHVFDVLDPGVADNIIDGVLEDLDAGNLGLGARA